MITFEVVVKLLSHVVDRTHADFYQLKVAPFQCKDAGGVMDPHEVGCELQFASLKVCFP